MGRNAGDQNGMFGKNHSRESRHLMSKAKSGLFDGKNNPMYGKSHSEEARLKVSEARKGKIWIYKDMITKSIPQEELETYIADGWTKGRAMDKRASKNYILNNFS